MRDHSFLSNLRWVALLFPIVLASCSYLTPSSVIQNRSKQYLSATNNRPMTLTPGMSSQPFHSYYPIPYRQYPEASKQVDLTPPGLYDRFG